MTHALNMTIPLKQDPDSRKKLEDLKRDFATKYQEKMDKALRDSKLVHFARVVVIDDKFLQVITEFEGDHKAYTEFFRRALPELFAAIFELAQGAPGFGQLNEQSFFEVSKSLQHRSLGESKEGETDGRGHSEGYLFSAYGGRNVKEILAKLEE
jgi:hypothetical protein